MVHTTQVQDPRRGRWWTLAFVGALLSLIAIERAIVPQLSVVDRPRILEWGITLDLTVVVPLLYYFTLVRRRGFPAITVIPVFILSTFVARAILPDGSHTALGVIEMLAIPAELLALFLIGRSAVRLTRALGDGADAATADFLTRARERSIEVIGARGPGLALAQELAIFYYGLRSWRDPVPEMGLSYHRKSGYGGVVFALSFAVLIETVAVHALLSGWSEPAAWVLTALSVYSLVWLLGDYRATKLRPHVLTARGVRLRNGLRWDVFVPRGQVERAALASGAVTAAKPDLSLTVPNAPAVRLELSSPAEAIGPYGIRKPVTSVIVSADDPDALMAALELDE